MRTVEEAKVESRRASRDMSPEAISRRFDILVELDKVARLSVRLAAGRRTARRPTQGKAAMAPDRTDLPAVPPV